MLQVVGAMARALVFRRERLESVGADAIAIGGELDLDHLGTHLTQQSRAGRSRDELREIQHPVALQHLRLVRHQLFPPNLYYLPERTKLDDVSGQPSSAGPPRPTV